jgi:hypothetical protein
MPSNRRAEAVTFKLMPGGQFYVSARMARAAADFLTGRSGSKRRLTDTLVRMVRQLHADDAPSYRWYTEDTDAIFRQALGERKRRLPSVAAVLRFQQSHAGPASSTLKAGFRGRQCRDHYEQALRRVAIEVGIGIPEVADVRDTPLHKWVQRGMNTARFWSHASRHGRP